MLNIVIPMAGRGSRFFDVGYTLPKPLIPVHGKPMIELVVHNIQPRFPHRFIFICQEEHLRTYDLEKVLSDLAPHCVVIGTQGVTEGAACTVLLAKKYIDSADSLMIANSDQWVDIDINAYLDTIGKQRLDGLIMTMKANDPKWSFVRLNSSGLVTEVREKEVISDEATVGIYNFASGSDFVRGAETMITQNIRVKNEFYVAPVYNLLIPAAFRVGIYNVGSELDGMYGLGIPSDLELFEKHPVSAKAVASAQL